MHNSGRCISASPQGQCLAGRCWVVGTVHIWSVVQSHPLEIQSQPVFLPMLVRVPVPLHPHKGWMLTDLKIFYHF